MDENGKREQALHRTSIKMMSIPDFVGFIFSPRFLISYSV
jgi:hypothetical protein